MGKHKAKLQKLNRNPPKREPYERVLIVCEGEKTEKYYFEYLRNKYKLSAINVEITNNGSSPKSVFEYAKQREKEEKLNKNGFDKIFCVFDKDKHESYEQIKNQLSQLSKNPIWELALINSVPCFEYWYLLHFKCTTQAFTNFKRKGGSSEEVIKELKKYLRNYEKSNRNIFKQLEENLLTAINNAEKSLKEAEKNQTDEPITRVFVLVKYLQKIKK